MVGRVARPFVAPRGRAAAAARRRTRHHSPCRHYFLLPRLRLRRPNFAIDSALTALPVTTPHYQAFVEMNAFARRCLFCSLRDTRLVGNITLRRRRPITLIENELTLHCFSTATSSTHPARPRAGGSRPHQPHNRRPRTNNNNRSNQSNKRNQLQGIRATIDFTNSLKRLVSSGDAKSLAEADRRLRYNLRYWNDNRTLARPNDYSFGVVLGAYSKARRIAGSAIRAEELLELMMDTYEMQEERDGNNVWLIPSAFCTSAAISAWSKNTNILFDKEMNPIERASAIVDRIEQLHERYGRPQTCPNEAVYNSLISVCAFVNNGRGAGRQLSVEQRLENAKYAESILDKMEAKYQAGDSSSRPNVRTYGSLIQTWAGASSISNPRAAERVEVILQHMENSYKRTGDIEIRPNFFCYTNAIHCWGRSERPDAVEKAIEIVERMERLSDSTENTEARPNAYAYCAVINALAKSRSSGHAGSTITGKEVGDKTDALLRRMKERGISPDRAVSNSALNAWARSGDPRTVARAEEIVSDMEKSTLARGTPDIATWNTLINVYTKSGDPAAPEKAERVLRKVESSYLDGSYDRRPQALTYSAVIQAWAKSCRPEAAKRARGIIDAMSKPKTGVGGRSLVTEPISVCYDGLIHALARSDEEDAVQQIEDTLRYMEKQASVGNTSIVPTTRTYQAAILGLSKRSDTNDGAAKAEKILRQMIELHKAGSHDVRPNNFVYSVCIQAFASLKSKEGAAKAYELLREMLLAYNKSGDRAIRPNEVTWSIGESLKRCTMDYSF